MKILFLTPWYPDELSMHGAFVQEQARALAKSNEIIVISSKVNYKEFGVFSYSFLEISDDSFQEKRIRVKSSFRAFNQLNYFVVSIFLTWRIAGKFKPDIIHGNIGYPGGFWSWMTSYLLNKPFVITEHTFIYNNFRSSFHKKLTLFALKRASAVITVSSKAGEEIKKYLPREVKVVPNILRVGLFNITPFPEGTVTIGFMGNLSSPTHVKGLDALLRILSKIKSDFRLLIGGEGSRMEEYKQMASQLGIGGKCHFYGFFPYDKGSQFMKQLHFFVNTSKHESFGIALTEAFASGLPVVSYNNGGPSDFVNESNGILVENQNEDEFLKATEWMMQNYMTYDREKIRASVVRQFSEQAFIERMNSIFDEVVKSFPQRQSATK